jgi:hypothetical protein
MTFRVFADWQPLSTAIEAQWNYNHYGIGVYLSLVSLWAGLLVSLALRRRGNDFPLVLIALVMSAAAIMSVRNVPLAAIACVIPLARHLGLLFSPSMQSPAEATLPLRAQWLIAGAALLLTGKEVFSTQLLADLAYPSTAVNFMKQHHLQGNVLGDFGWGEYLIWHLAPGSKVFVDSRYDMVYPPHVIQDYLTFYYQWAGADKVLKAYRHDFVLIPPDAKPYGRMLKMADWKLIYHDGRSALFARTGSRAAQLPGIPFTGSASSLEYFP